MPRPLTKEPPKGSQLEKMVNALRAAAAADRGTFWQYFVEYSHQGGLSGDVAERAAVECRAFAAQMRLKEDPRLWAHPMEFVRDHLVLPAIANVDGPAVAEALKGTHVLDEYTDFFRDAVKRDTPAHKRQAPAEDIAPFVWAAVIGVAYDAGASTPNARYVRAARLLNVNRHAVRRTVENFHERVAGLPECDRQLVMMGTAACRKYLMSVDLWPSCSSPTKRN